MERAEDDAHVNVVDPEEVEHDEDVTASEEGKHHIQTGGEDPGGRDQLHAHGQGHATAATLQHTHASTLYISGNPLKWSAFHISTGEKSECRRRC